MSNNRNIKECVAKKDYVCNYCGKEIKKGSKYYRININYKGIFHFCNKECSKKYDFGKDINTYEPDIDFLNEIY